MRETIRRILKGFGGINKPPRPFLSLALGSARTVRRGRLSLRYAAFGALMLVPAVIGAGIVVLTRADETAVFALMSLLALGWAVLLHKLLIR